MSRYLVPLIDGLRLAAREVWTDLSGDYQAVEVFHLDLTRKAQETPWLVIDLRLLPSGQRKAETAVDRSSEGMAVLYRVVTDGESLDELIGKLEDLRDQLEDAEPAPGRTPPGAAGPSRSCGA